MSPFPYWLRITSSWEFRPSDHLLSITINDFLNTFCDVVQTPPSEKIKDDFHSRNWTNSEKGHPNIQIDEPSFWHCHYKRQDCFTYDFRQLSSMARGSDGKP